MGGPSPRHAQINVGGGGGMLGGGGGGGGILQIFGSTRPPARSDPKGQDGQFPGGGGGGGGVVEFIGREVDSDDLANGFDVSSVFFANSVSMTGTLFNVLGAGWSYIPIATIPSMVRPTLVIVFEFGRVQPETLLRVDVDIVRPDGSQFQSTFVDVAVPASSADLVLRGAFHRRLEFEVVTFGVWRVVLRSSARALAALAFECRQGTPL